MPAPGDSSWFDAVGQRTGHRRPRRPGRDFPAPAPAQRPSSRVAATPDSSLLAALRRDDRDALGIAFQAYSPDMFRLARSVTGSAADADDVVQDVFLGLPHAIRGFEERCELEEWLRRVALLRARMLLRSRRRRRELPLPDDGEHPLLSSATSIDGIALERAISALPACYQMVVLLKEWVGLSHREIADELGITVNTSCVRLCRARRMLRELL